jgi:hypothetical protein
VERGGRLQGVLSWQATTAHANTLWLAAPHPADPASLQALLAYARSQLSLRRSLTLDYPAHRATEAIEAGGFYEHQTLIWMSVTFH